MMIGQINAAGPALGAQKPTLGAVVEKLAGSLWYDLMTEMSRNGLDAGALGPGGETYQSLSLWDIAQKDFTKYDTAIVQAAMRQLSGPGDAPAIRRLTPILADNQASSTAMSEAAAVAADSDGDQADQARAMTRAIWSAVKIAARALGVPPVGLLAQAALETGWGAAMPGYNAFGVKAGGDAPASARATHEMINGALVPITDRFRDYPSPEDSLSDYVQLIRSNFPNVVGQSSVETFARALQAGGFATDTAYAEKIIAIAHSPLMQQVLRDLDGPADESGADRGQALAGPDE